MNAQVKEDFYRRFVVRPGSRCWVWTNSRDRDGYGQFQIVDSPSKKAHRASWILHHGEIPDGLCVLHNCDNPPCVNPEHLFLGTNKDNTHDSVLKRRHVHGDRRYDAKLTESNVIEIKTSAGISQRALAKKFGVSESQVSMILSGKRWKHV